MAYDIYEPREDSYLLLQQIKEHAFGRVLDMGTGSGILALAASACLRVREVVAVDINEEAILQLQQKIKAEHNKKVSAQISDLFSAPYSKFDTIVFNPPYLPQDKIGGRVIEDASLYGGKKGYEISARFLSQAAEYLVNNGKILFLFSSLTHKDKIEELIQNHMFTFEQLDSRKLAFEVLYVYLIQKDPVLCELQKKDIRQVHFLARGKRSNVFIATLYKPRGLERITTTVAIKVWKSKYKVESHIEHEAKWLRLLNTHGIGQQYMFHSDDYMVSEFIDGKNILDWVEDAAAKDILNVLKNVLKQCYVLDTLGINKEEMHHPHKHIIVDKFNVPVMIDFERVHETTKPHNVTQFLEFIARNGELLKKNEVLVDKQKIQMLAQEYKHDRSIFGSLLKEVL